MSKWVCLDNLETTMATIKYKGQLYANKAANVYQPLSSQWD